MLGEDEAEALRIRGARHLANARMLDQGPALSAASRPTPRPRAELQPLSLSVTDVAGLIRDPYAVYARDVLGLDPLDPLQPGLDASDRGNIIHAALARFMEAASVDWPDDPLAALLAIGREEFAAHMENESVAAFWWPTFARAAAWFVEEAGRRRRSVAAAFAEKGGVLPVALADGAVLSLRGRGDLFERMTDGTLAVTDYKTGALPGEKEVRAGNQPQLTLMAAMVRAGVISGVPAGEVGAIRYVKIGQESFVREVPFKAGEPDLPTTAARHLADLAALMGRLRAGDEAYVSRRKLKLARDGGPYDHLARVKEWLSLGAD
jgi:ATP-dependent helicase/nuclease subunit B